MSADEKLIEAIAVARVGRLHWERTTDWVRRECVEHAARQLANLRAAGYLLIPTEGPEGDAALDRALARWFGEPTPVNVGYHPRMKAALRDAGRVE